MHARDLPDLIVFLEVVRAGSLTRAAGRLHTVQSNVTARIKNLERATGVPLLRRHARGVTPTAAGETVLELARRADALLEELRFTFGRSRSKNLTLRIGAIETVAASRMPAVMSEIGRRHDGLHVTLQSGSSSALLADLKRGELDCVFVSRAPGLAGFREQLAFVDELVAVAPRSIRTLMGLVPVSGSL